MREYLLHEHHDLVEKGCYNYLTKIFENWHLFWSQISSGYLCYPEFALWDSSLFFKEFKRLNVLCLVYLRFTRKWLLDPGFQHIIVNTGI